MRRCLGLACAVLVLMAVGAWAAETADEPDSAAREMAMRCYKGMGYQKAVDQTLQLMVSQMPDEYREDFMSHSLAFVSEKYEPGMADLLVEHFTLEELKAMAEFYDSDMGRAIAAKIDPFTLTVMKFHEQQVMLLGVSFLDAHPEIMEENP